MRIVWYTFICCLVTVNLSGQYNDPNFPKPASGYGADGPHTVDTISFVNPDFTTKNIQIFYPSDISTKLPTIFYSHAFGGNDPANIGGLLNFVAKKGYAIVFVPYQTIGVTIDYRYQNLLNGFRLAARKYPNIIDTTKVGFLGWSFGGGACFANAYTCFTEDNWGSNGRFIYAMAQWYSFNISPEQLQTFPADTKLLTEIFNDDVTNDHRMAIDIFNNINIPLSEKDFIILRSDTIAGYVYMADHTVPQTSPAFNALDYYGIYGLLDALCDYTFNGSAAGKNVALGNGSAEQITMPAGLKNLIETDDPPVMYPEDKYKYPCSDTTNPRSSFCLPITSYVIEAGVYPANSGAITGTGTFDYGTTVSLTAVANNSYTFTNWTENGKVVSTNTPYSFIADSNRTLTANFSLNTGLKNNVSNNSFVLFPNPAHALVNIKPSVNNLGFNVNIYDFTGKKVYSGKNVLQIDLSNFSNGFYWVTIHRKEIFWQTKLIKQ